MHKKRVRIFLGLQARRDAPRQGDEVSQEPRLNLTLMQRKGENIKKRGRGEA